MQNYKNHTKLTPEYHGVLLILLLVYITGAGINLYQQWPDVDHRLQSELLVGIGIIFLVMASIIRTFPLKAQDRIIRAEENMRHYVLTGKLLDERLTMGQIIALRFASDEELLSLTQRAIAENLSAKEIKQAVQNWRPDSHRI